MSYKEVTMYTVICERCGADACEGTDYAGWSCKEGAWESCCDYWHEIAERHYCPDCVEWNEDESELIPKAS